MSSRFTEAKAMKKSKRHGGVAIACGSCWKCWATTEKIRPMATRCADVFTPPLAPSPHAEALRAELQSAMTAWEEVLAKDFRTGPAR